MPGRPGESEGEPWQKAIRVVVSVTGAEVGTTGGTGTRAGVYAATG